jgi:DNA-binding response OmpR family regulator
MAKILIADDEPSLRFLITSTLEDEGYELLEAADGLQAYDLILKEKPDMVILDVMMPGLTGYEICTKIKKSTDLKNIIVIMLTAKGQEKDREQSILSGADLYMRKPFSPFQLLENVAALLNN